MIIITKSFVYQGDAAGKDVGSLIYLDDAATVTIDGEKIFFIFVLINLYLIRTCLDFYQTQF